MSRQLVDPPVVSGLPRKGWPDLGACLPVAWVSSWLSVLLVVGLLAPSAGLAQAQGASAATVSGAPNPPVAGQALALNFKDADIDSVVGAFGHLLNRTFIVDPRVRGKITLETPRPVSPARAYELLKSSLRLQGFAIVESGAIARVLPEADAKLQAGPVGVGQAPGAGDQIVTQVFRLNYESASGLVPVLRPLIAPNNTIAAYPNNNTLVITDYASNLQRLGRLIATLDSPASGEVEIIPVRLSLIHI